MRDYWLWILGGGLMQIPAIEQAHNMGFKVIVSDRDPKCACAELADEFAHIDIFDIEGHMRKLMSGLPWEIQGVLCAGIDCPETAAMMQGYLGKPSAPPDVARLCHNKREFRKAMRVLGYPVPAEREVVVKPLENSGSRGLRLYASTDSQCVEEMWHGTEHTVETLFDVHGQFWPLFITDRHFDYSDGYALETGLRHPSVLPDYVQRKAFQIARHLGEDLGVGHGPFKLDIVVTKDGVRVIEATTRFSGGFDCQYLVPAATGKNILRAAIQTCTGHPISGLYEVILDRVSLSESLWPEPGTRIVAIDGVELARMVPGVEQVIFRKGIGDMVESYVDCGKRVCFIITSGRTEKEARDAMTRAKEVITIKTEQITDWVPMWPA